ncbi:MAG: hypothetical protein NC182_06795 [Prevotella sp.]|nr:hypothetical protein [Staphylococcus sp.]MCM1350894.1 hypothetical protein [Prevotella sp.]
MYLGVIIDWLNQTGEKVSDIILNPFLSLPGFLKLIAVVIIALLSIIGLIRVARKALKTVVGVACVFIILLVAWLILGK